MKNEQEFFKELLKLEKIQYSTPLSETELDIIFWDVANGKHAKPFIELARRIENAHGIGVYDDQR